MYTLGIFTFTSRFWLQWVSHDVHGRVFISKLYLNFIYRGLVSPQGNAGKVNTWRINSLSHTLRYWLPMSARDNWPDDYNRLSLLPANDLMFTLSAHVALLQDTILMILLTWLKDLTMKSSIWVTFAWKRENDRHTLFGVNDQEKRVHRQFF